MRVNHFTLTPEAMKAAPYASTIGYAVGRDCSDVRVLDDHGGTLWVRWLDGRQPQIFPLAHVPALYVNESAWP